MTDAAYTAIFMPINQCPLMGIESIVKSEIIGDYRVTITKDNFNQYRVTLKDRSINIIVSAILFDQFRIVKFKSTLTAYRGQGFTKQLFAYIEMNVKKKFRHSDHLTEAGKAAI